jgi:hypothetical protein
MPDRTGATPGIRRWAAASLVAALALGTATAAAQTASNHLACVVDHSPENGRLATCTGRVSSRYPEWTFVLRGRPPNLVTRIEIYQRGQEAPRQVLSGFELKPNLVRGDGVNPGRVDFVLQDVNFDRLTDLRLAVGPAEGDGVAYRWFLFDRDTEEFVATDALDAIRNPVFNPRRRLVLGAFKDERGRSGLIAFKWREGKLEPISAIARERTQDGRCIATHYVLRDGQFEKRRETECRPGAEPEVE